MTSDIERLQKWAAWASDSGVPDAECPQDFDAAKAVMNFIAENERLRERYDEDISIAIDALERNDRKNTWKTLEYFRQALKGSADE